MYETGRLKMKEASYWHESEHGGVVCDLCPHSCHIKEGGSGFCKVRSVEDGRLTATSYGLISSHHIDPVEKKPLYHFLPGSAIFSVGGWGCNFACDFCQNWSISQRIDENGTRVSPSELVMMALAGGSASIAYTYNEPLVGFEFVRDCAEIARSEGLHNVLVTNGYITSKPASDLLPLIDALNIDIKSMTNEFYRKYCRASLAPVLEFACQAAASGCHVELTHLMIPSLNDATDQVIALADWIYTNLGDRTPLHLSAYHPQYKLKIEATRADTLERAFEICERVLKFVYLGNVATGSGQNTVCPQCGHTVIRRRGYGIRICGMTDGKCKACGCCILSEGCF